MRNISIQAQLVSLKRNAVKDGVGTSVAAWAVCPVLVEFAQQSDFHADRDSEALGG